MSCTALSLNPHCFLCALAAISSYMVVGVPQGKPTGTPTIFISGMGTAAAGKGSKRVFRFTRGVPTAQGKYK